MAILRATGIHFSLHVPLFGAEVVFIFGYSESQLGKILDKYDLTPQFKKDVLADDNRELVGFMVEDFQTGHYLVYMPELPDDNNKDGTLTHELLHLTEHILNRAGVKHQLGVSNEVYCYLIGWLKAEVNTRIWKAINFNS